MMQVLYVGLTLGTLLFLSKVTLIFFLPKRIQRFINYNNFTLLMVDIILGMLAAKTLSIADGTIALGASITFGFLSIVFIISKIIIKKVKKLGGELICVSGRH